MSDLFDIAKEFGFLSVAIIIGTYRYRYLDRFFLVLFLQACLAMVFLIGAHVSLHYFSTNHWIYNIYLPLEILFVLCAATFLFRRAIILRVFLPASALFLVVYAAEITLDGFLLLANMTLALGGIMLVVIYLLILFQGMRAAKGSTHMMRQLWACLGIALYFAGNVPFMALFHQLQNYDPNLVNSLFYITEFLANARYALLCISFYQIGRQQQMTAV